MTDDERPARCIYEKCHWCGERQAWHEGDMILVAHNCDKQPPGPPDPPRRHPVDKVRFVRGEFTQEQWRKEFDALSTGYRLALEDRLDASDRLRRVREALGGWTDWRERDR